MRPIKFRAWNGKNMESMEELLEPVEIEDLSLLDYLLLEDKRWHNYVLMQFTGLLDRNGKEIYEGDILRCEGETNQPPVNFYRGCFYVSGTPFSDIDEELIEVIGNIYENPELVK